MFLLFFLWLSLSFFRIFLLFRGLVFGFGGRKSYANGRGVRDVHVRSHNHGIVTRFFIHLVINVRIMRLLQIFFLFFFIFALIFSFIFLELLVVYCCCIDCALSPRNNLAMQGVVQNKIRPLCSNGVVSDRQHRCQPRAVIIFCSSVFRWVTRHRIGGCWCAYHLLKEDQGPAEPVSITVFRPIAQVESWGKQQLQLLVIEMDAAETQTDTDVGPQYWSSVA